MYVILLSHTVRRQSAWGDHQKSVQTKNRLRRGSSFFIGSWTRRLFGNLILIVESRAHKILRALGEGGDSNGNENDRILVAVDDSNSFHGSSPESSESSLLLWRRLGKVRKWNHSLCTLPIRRSHLLFHSHVELGRPSRQWPSPPANRCTRCQR